MTTPHRIDALSRSVNARGGEVVAIGPSLTVGLRNTCAPTVARPSGTRPKSTKSRTLAVLSGHRP